MIGEALTKRQNPAVTSDQWHVVHAEWCGKRANHPPFARHVVSEHADRDAAVVAAKALAAELDGKLRTRPVEQRDQIFVRPPRFRSLKYTAHRQRKRPR